MKPIWLLFFIWIYPFAAAEGSHRFVQLSGSAGLSQNSVTAVVQDKAGRLWIATRDGLNLWDGYRFRVFKTDPSDPASLPENQINCLAADTSGRIWIGTQGAGMLVYHLSTGRFSQPVSKEKTGLNIRAILISSDSRLWIGSDDQGLVLAETSGNVIRKFSSGTGPGQISHPRIRALTEDRTGAVWAGTFGGGLNRIDKQSLGTRQFTSGPGSFLPDNRIWSLLAGRDGLIWIGTFGGGLVSLNPESNKGTLYFPDRSQSASGNIWSMMEDYTGRIWIGTYGAGLFSLDKNRDKLVPVPFSGQSGRAKQESAVFCLFVDRSGMLWAGTETSGLFRTDLKPNRFDLLNNETVPGLLPHPGVMSVLEDRDGQLWFGTLGGGLSRYQPETGETVHITRENQKLSGNFILSLLESDGWIWTGTGSGLSLVNRKTGQVSPMPAFRNQDLSPAGQDIRVMVKGPEDKIWIGTNGGGLFLADARAKFYTRFRREDSGSGLLSNTIRAIASAGNGSLWVGTSQGLNLFTPATGVWKAWTSGPEKSGGLTDQEIRCLYSDEKNKVLWIGTPAGLNRLETETGRVTHFLEKDGLPNGFIYGILPDREGHLWVSTNHGLARLTPATGIIRAYDETDGLQSNEFNGGAWFKSDSGRLYFGGINGVTAFNPGEVQDNPYLPNLVLTDFRILNQPVPGAGDLAGLKQYTLKPRQTMISFEFAATDFTNPEKNQYRYRLEGFDEDWIQAGTRRFVTYTNLDPGDYTFRVSGSNNDGLWNDGGLSVYLIVRPPFYKTTWFLALVLAGLISAVYFFGKWRQSVKERREKERIELLRQVTIGVLHEIRQPLQIVHGNLDILGLMDQDPDSGMKDPIEKATGSVNRIKNLLRKLEELLNDAKFKTKSYTRDQQMIDLTGDNE